MPVSNSDIRKMANTDRDFRRGIPIRTRSQVMLVCLRPGEEIGGETPAGSQSRARAKRADRVYAPAEPACGNMHATRAGAMAAGRSRKSKREKPLIQRISNAQGESA